MTMADFPDFSQYHQAASPITPPFLNNSNHKQQAPLVVTGVLTFSEAIKRSNGEGGGEARSAASLVMANVAIVMLSNMLYL